MKIGFIYNAPCNVLEIFQHNSPQPIPMAAAATCYLAIQLAKIGNDITIFSQSPSADVFNVRCRHIEIKNQALVLDPALLENNFEVLIFNDASPEFALSIKNILPYQPKIYLWTEQALESPLSKGLYDPKIVDQLTGIVFVSFSQRTTFLDALQLPTNKVFAIKYGISPLFEDLFLDGKEFMQVKSKVPRMAYISKQDDGLDVLLGSYYNISDNYEGAELGIFSEITDPDLQAQIEQSKGIKVYGVLPNIQLVSLMRTYTVFVSPNTVNSTYNVSLLEAMAAGLYPLLSDLGANADYSYGHGKMIAENLLRGDSLDNYISELLAVCAAQLRQANDFYEYCFNMSLDINKKHTWRVRAKEWLDLLEGTE